MKRSYEFPIEVQHIHFVGIGGSGMSPLAEILYGDGYKITGSDNSESDNLDRIKKLGIEVHLGHDAQNISGADIVVYTAAVNKDNPELVAAKENNILLLERAKLLGIITKAYSDTIAISGTHGKTTTTSMISQITIEANLDPAIFIGGRLPLINANGQAGNSNLMVCEACEFMDHYLEMYPDTAIILNVDADHLDYFGSLDNVIKSFHNFAKRATKRVLYNADDLNTCKAVKGIDSKKLISYGLSDLYDWYAININKNNGAYGEFDLYHKKEFFAHIVLSVPGNHNVQNATVAAAAAYYNGATKEQIIDGLQHFTGAGRRFETIGKINDIVVIDDFAHHPTEINASLSTAKSMNYNHVWAVFQPYTFSRTYLHLDAFANALSVADTAIISDIMGSREINTYGVHTTQITDKMTTGIYIPDFPEITDYIVEHAKPGDLVITMGGGNVYKCARMIFKSLKDKYE